MKKILTLGISMAFLSACGPSGSSAETEQAEMQAADSISNMMQQEREDVSAVTTETLQEVDSLLENL